MTTSRTGEGAGVQSSGRGGPGRSRRRRVVAAILGLVALGSVALLVVDGAISAAASDRIGESPENLRAADVALVLGTGPTTAGRPNGFFEARMDAAAALFREGVVRGLLVSGDNSRADYDEPSAMRDALVARGVPREFITCDYAGFSTLDSVRRAGPVFGQARVIIVSQRFHLERALYLASASGLEAEGFVAADVDRRWHWRARLREVLARGKAVLDVLLDRGPRFLGEREEVALVGEVESGRDGAFKEE